MRTDDAMFYRPVLWIGGGGIGNMAMLALRIAAHRRFDLLPASWRYLAIEFASDPPSPAHVTDDPTEQQAAALDPADMALLQGVPWDPARLADRIEHGDPEYAWMAELIAPGVLRTHGGGEAMQVPVFTRAALAYAIRAEGRRSWYARLLHHLGDLVPNGAARHELLQRGVPRASIEDGRTAINILVGSQGGCGHGLALPCGIAARHLARAISPIEINLFVVNGDYRPIDGQERRKRALSAALFDDLEVAMQPGRILQYPIAPNRYAAAAGPLYDRITVIEAGGRLRHDHRNVAAAAADALLYEFATRPGYEMAKSRVNIRHRARLHHHLEEARA